MEFGLFPLDLNTTKDNQKIFHQHFFLFSFHEYSEEEEGGQTFIYYSKGRERKGKGYPTRSTFVF